MEANDWPRTTRVLPWLIALFLMMVYWVPFDSVSLPVSLPINSELDRFVVGGLFLLWVLVALCSPSVIKFRSAPINVAIYVFLVAALASLVANLRQLAWEGDLTLSLKQLSLIVSYLAAYLVVSTVMRRSEVTAYAKLLVFLGVGTALGTVYQYLSGSNPFFFIAKLVFVGARVTSSATGVAAIAGPNARPSITGPALHGLADATLISTAVPFCICLAASARTLVARCGWWLAIIVLLAGCLATGRKTALVDVALSFMVLIFYERKTYARYVPAPLLAIGCLYLVAPHLLQGLFHQVATTSSSTSTTSRTADYAAVVPDVVSHLLIGRGYGSFDPLKYRILDDQMLGWLVQVGVIGAVAYAGMMVALVITVNPVARSATTRDTRLMQAVAAASLGYFATNFLYDTFGFRQAPYTFFFFAAMGVAYAGRQGGRPLVVAGDLRAAKIGLADQPMLTADTAAQPSVPQRATNQDELVAAEIGASRLEPAPTSPSIGATSPLLSILIVSYRNPEVTRSGLQAVERETEGTGHEVLVLDNASPDGTGDMIAQEFPSVDVDLSKVNLGFARANNLLAERAKGQFFLLLNPDAILHAGAVKALLEFSRRQPGAGVWGGRTLRPSGELDPSSCWGFQSLWSLACFASGLSSALKRNRFFDPESLGRWNRDSERRVDVVTGCMLLIRAELWRDLGGFDEEFWMYGEDQDLGIRAMRAGYRPMITPDAVATHVVGASSAPGSKNVMLLSARVRLMRKHWSGTRTRLGIFLLTLGCGLRAVSAGEETGWREGWRRRTEWQTGATHPPVILAGDDD